MTERCMWGHETTQVITLYRTYIHANEDKYIWGNLNEIGGLYQSQYPGCNILFSFFFSFAK